MFTEPFPVSAALSLSFFTACNPLGLFGGSSSANAQKTTGTVSDQTNKVSPGMNPPIHKAKSGTKAPTGVEPYQICDQYSLDCNGGDGEIIVLVEAYGSPSIVADLKAFDDEFEYNDLADFTTATSQPSSTATPYLYVQQVAATAATQTDTAATVQGWAVETSLDVEWAHAIAPYASIIVLEAASQSTADLAAAIRLRPHSARTKYR